MAYNSYFPAGYQGYYNPYQQNGFQQPVQNLQTMQQTQMAQNLQPAQMAVANQQQMMTPPTIHAEIVQVGSKEEGKNFPVGVGSSQMMMMKDDSAIFIKTVLANNQSVFDVYVKAAEAQKNPDDDFLTRGEFNAFVASLEAKQTPQKKTGKKDDAE